MRHPWVSRLNYVAAALLGVPTVLGVLLMLSIGEDPLGEGRMWGFLMLLGTAPGAVAFWLSGRAWGRGWALSPVLQFLPLVATLGWWWLLVTMAAA